MNTENLVVALDNISEDNFAGETEFCHAKAGDIGVVEEVDLAQGCATVTWRRTGTATACLSTEFCRASDPRAAALLKGQRSD